MLHWESEVTDETRLTFLVSRLFFVVIVGEGLQGGSQ